MLVALQEFLEKLLDKVEQTEVKRQYEKMFTAYEDYWRKDVYTVDVEERW